MTARDGPVEPVERVAGTAIPLRGSDVDTDQILPARFMTATTFEGLGEHVFADRRTDDPDHPFADPRFADAGVLVVNDNFGCGSSREHAPQALARWGIDAVVGESFAEIFAGNCLALGIPTVTAGRESLLALQDRVEATPETEVVVHVADERVAYGEETIEVGVEPAQRRALVDGVWDTTALLRSNAEAIARTARQLPYVEPEEVPDVRPPEGDR